MKLLNNILLKILILIHIIFQILDGTFTYIGVSTYGLEIEGNPIIVYFMKIMGIEIGILFPKIIGILLILYISIFLIKYKYISYIEKLGFWSLILINLFYAWVVSVWAYFLFYIKF
jgi:hypothetical protein